MKIANLILSLILGIAILATFIINFATSGSLDWFFIVLSGLIVFAVNWFAPQFLKKHYIHICTAINAVLALSVLIVINLYTGNFGWCFTIGLPIILSAVCAIYLTLLIATFRKLNLFHKISLISFLWLLIANIIPLVLKLFSVDVSEQGMFWQANLSNWSTSKLISANVILIVDLAVAMLIISHIVLGFVLENKRRKK